MEGGHAGVGAVGGVESALRRCMEHFEVLVSVEDAFAGAASVVPPVAIGEEVEGTGGEGVNEAGGEGGGAEWLREVTAVVREVACALDVSAVKTQDELVCVCVCERV